MNRAVVIRAASGIADYLLGELDGVTPAAARRRRLRRAAQVPRLRARHRRRAHGRRASRSLLLPSALPTPVLAFAVRHLERRRGDHGHRVAQPAAGQRLQGLPRRPRRHRLGSGRADRRPRRRGDRARDRPRPVGRLRAPRASAAGPCSTTASSTPTSRARVALADPAPAPPPPTCGSSSRRCTASAARSPQRVLAEAGFTDVLVVPEQAEPDGDFPERRVPQPRGAGRDRPRRSGWRATRARTSCSRSTRTPTGAPPRSRTRARASYRGPDTAAAEGWRMLHGDETGALLGPRSRPTGSRPSPARSTRRRRSRARSSPRACSPASPQSAGVRHAQTLTGFKWISRVDGLVFGYEEALGYCVDPAHVRDKDGITAALLVAGLAARLKAAGRTLVDELDDLARAHGLHLTDQVSARFTDLAADRRDRRPPALGAAHDARAARA